MRMRQLVVGLILLVGVGLLVAGVLPKVRGGHFDRSLVGGAVVLIVAASAALRRRRRGAAG